MGIGKAIFGNNIRNSAAICSTCKQQTDARVRVRNGGVWLDVLCPQCGLSSLLQSRHVAHYRLMETMLVDPPKNFPRSYDIAAPKNIRGVFIDVTQKCNLGCPNCLADSETATDINPPSISEAMEALQKLLPYKPVIYLSGGEPTLNPELPQWLSRLTGEGYDVKLLTNGLKLVDEEYCRKLKGAGASWVLLQFDSLDDRELEAIRGRKGILKKRLAALSNLSELNMNICLACMIDRNHNLGGVGELIRFGFKTKGVRHVSLMPARRIGRGRLTDDENLLDELELIEAIRQQTGSRIAYRDWMLFFAAMSAYYRATGSPDFVPRRCFLPLPLVGNADKYYPATRIGGFLHDSRNLRAFFRMASKKGRLESADLSEGTLLISIETFRESHNIDIGDAARCSRYYLDDGKIHQACIYNALLRKGRNPGGHCDE